VGESKDMTTEEPEELPAPDEVVEAVPELAEPLEAVAAVAPVAAGRKAPGTKEPIPFRWKLVGESGGVVLTLFKATQREDVDGQCDRVRSEGYYTNLRVVDINEKLVQPPAEKPAKAVQKAAKAQGAAKPAKAQAAAKPQKAEGDGRTARASKSRAVPKARPAVAKARSAARKTATPPAKKRAPKKR